MMTTQPKVLLGLPKKPTATRVHQLDLKTPLPARGAVLENYANKAHLNSLLCVYSNGRTMPAAGDTHHRLVVTDDDASIS